MIENRARLRIVRLDEKPPYANVIPFRSRDERARDAHNMMEPELRSEWMVFLKDLNPQEADVMWRVLMHQSDAHIAYDLDLSVAEVHGIIDEARSKIGGQISG